MLNIASVQAEHVLNVTSGHGVSVLDWEPLMTVTHTQHPPRNSHTQGQNIEPIIAKAK